MTDKKTDVMNDSRTRNETKRDTGDRFVSFRFASSFRVVYIGDDDDVG